MHGHLWLERALASQGGHTKSGRPFSKKTGFFLIVFFVFCLFVFFVDVHRWSALWRTNILPVDVCFIVETGKPICITVLDKPDYAKIHVGIDAKKNLVNQYAELENDIKMKPRTITSEGINMYLTSLTQLVIGTRNVIKIEELNRAIEVLRTITVCEEEEQMYSESDYYEYSDLSHDDEEEEEEEDVM